MVTTSVKLANIDASALPLLAIEIARELANDCKYDLSITKHRGFKTSSQNKYFHKLIELLRLELSKDKHTNYSFTRMKNEMVTSYGPLLSEQCVMTTVPPEEMRESARPHAKYIKSETVTDTYGVEIETHWYQIYKNVEDMNTLEMARLISGTVQECENLGMDVMTPDEKAQLGELLRNAKEINSR